MLARVVLAGLLLEIVVYASVAAWLHLGRGWSMAALAMAAVAVALLARLLLVGFTFSLGWLHRSPREPAHRITAGATLRMVLREWRAVLADNFAYLPFERVALRADRPRPSAQPPVVLVHGYLSNRGYFRPLVRSLESRDPHRAVFTPTFSVLFTTIERFAAELHEAIESVVRVTGQPRVILACHSMGGLAAREYLRAHGPSRVERLVTIASPHHGTAIAALGLGQNARQMGRRSAFLQRLAASEGEGGPGVDAVSIWSAHDNLVAPQEASRLPWARSVTLAGIGHVSILSSPALFEAVDAALPRSARGG
jgi:triacylglycerol esterase/lipase EstA (alpha/beta hydrolase family)